MALKFEDMEGKFIRYKSDATAKDGGGFWYGLVRNVDNGRDEIEINGCIHTKSSIEVLEILNIE